MLVSRVMDGYLWNEVVCNGGYDVLAKPLREDEVCRVVKLARSYWISALKRRRFLGNDPFPHCVQDQVGEAVKI